MRRFHSCFAIFVMVLIVVACEEPQQTVEIVRPVKAMKVQNVEAFARRFFPGRASATREINIAFEVSGRLIERPINVGDQVKQGDLLAKLDPRDFRNKLEQAQAAAAREKALRDRVARALKSGAVAEQQLTDAEARLQAASNEVEVRRKALEDSEIRAPFDGTIAATYVENFQNVVATQSIMRLLDTSQIEFLVNIPESLISNAPYVRDVSVEFDAFPGQKVSAQIKEISNEASEATRTYPVNLIMDQPEGFTILPGMAGKATAERIDLPDAAKVTGYEVPMTALYNPTGDETLVWVIDEGAMTVSRRAVEQIEATERGVKVKGIEPGEWIAIAGVEYLRDGQTVRILE